jgi:hypothetical protein
MSELSIDPFRNIAGLGELPNAQSPDDVFAWKATLARLTAPPADANPTAGLGAHSGPNEPSTTGQEAADNVARSDTLTTPAEPQGSSWSLWIHGGLTAGSFWPSLVGAAFSAADGAVYAVEGDRKNAVLSFGAAGVGIFTDAGAVKMAALGLGVATKVGCDALKAGGVARKVEKVAGGPIFDELRSHARRHSNLSPNAYYNQAVHHAETAQKFKFYHDGQFKNAFITRTGSNSFTLTSATPSGNRIFTHMEGVTREYLENIGITLPKGF